MYAALGRAPVSIVAPLVATYPVATLALGALMLRTPLTRALIAGVSITVTGVLLLLGVR